MDAGSAGQPDLQLVPVGTAPPRAAASEQDPAIYLVAAFHITGVAVIGDHSPRLLFEDGTVGDVRFDDTEWTGVFEPLRDAAEFAKVLVDNQFGTIAWPNGLDMAPEPLYEAAPKHPVRSAASAH